MTGGIAGLVRLDGTRLADALRAGIYRVFAQSEHLDKINVFPVADGDTGTNMAMTLAAVLAAIDREPTPHAGKLLLRAADAAIDGSRGNSGAILAQFLYGLGERLGHLPAAGIGDFAAGALAGARYAHEALAEPREGTLLTVLRDFAQELVRLADEPDATDFSAVFAGGLARARVSLAATSLQLEALRAAGVVDAGAQGFVEVLEGMSHHFRTGETTTPVAPRHRPEELLAGVASGSVERYCAECVLAGESLDARRIREALGALGSSLVVAGSRRKLRLHLHTDDPEEMFRVAAGFGAVSARKADDLQRQQAAAHHARSRRVAVVTDSAADLPEEALERLELHVIPVRVNIGERSHLDKITLTPEELYRELERGAELPKTSQPPPGDFRRMYEFLTSHYDAVVSIALSARLSGTCAAARAAAEHLPGGRVTVIDSLNASVGQGLVAACAAECAQAGGSPEQVIDAARQALSRTRTFGLLPKLDYAVRGGRVPAILKTLASILRFAPVLTNFPDGRIAACGVIFGRRRLRARFARYVRRRLDPHARYRIAVGHANAPEEGRRLLEELVAGLRNVRSGTLTAVGTALGVHGGPGMLVVGVQACAEGAEGAGVTVSPEFPKP